jgi:transposase
VEQQCGKADECPLVQALRAEVKKLAERVEELERRLGRNSRNSSRPPSGDPPGVKREPKTPTGRKPGGQPGHEGCARAMFPPGRIDRIVPVRPERCAHCGGMRFAERPAHVRRHQQVELPPIRPVVAEYRLETLECLDCHAHTSAELPDGVLKSGCGPRLHAAVALMTGAFRLSKRMAKEMLGSIFNVPISAGSIPACESRVSEALKAPVDEAREYVRDAAVLHADETGWKENNRKAWLWTAAAKFATVFMVHRSRGGAAARALLGRFAGVLCSDRWGAYGVFRGLRQLCWAHLRRDFEAFGEYKGAAGRIGRRLLRRVGALFRLWNRVRDGTLDRKTFQARMKRVKRDTEMLLAEGAACGQARVERSCRRILKLKSALWTFVDVEGVEPTNNAAERALRHAVLWRRSSFGTQSEDGSRFVERILTAVATCRQQGRNVLEYLTEACIARAEGRPAPSLLPSPHASSIAAG